MDNSAYDLIKLSQTRWVCGNLSNLDFKKSRTKSKDLKEIKVLEIRVVQDVKSKWFWLSFDEEQSFGKLE